MIDKKIKKIKLMLFIYLLLFAFLIFYSIFTKNNTNNPIIDDRIEVDYKYTLN